jgi:cyclopropane-fatty-acyl-phospholipid synthase
MSTDLQQVAQPTAGATRPMSVDNLLARGLLPDWLIRQGIRSLLRGRLREQSRGTDAVRARARQAFIEELKASPIAIDTDAANRQHYEVPTAFYQLCLGKRLKYSSGLWPKASRRWTRPRRRCSN